MPEPTSQWVVENLNDAVDREFDSPHDELACAWERMRTLEA